MTSPPQSNALSKAIDEFRHALGSEWVFVNDEHRVGSYADPFPVDDPGRYAPVAAIAPAGVEQIQAVLKIANRYGTPLWTVSTGRNFGYGGAAPRLPGSVVVDLSRMNRIIEVNEKSAYCVVEPGVTYFQLYDYLKQRQIKLWVAPPEPGWASVIGNALDHGVGYTPMADNFGFSCGMEVILADGNLVRTGMGAMAGSNTWQLFKYGFGPVLDGIFSQSNFGIVTKLGMWLMPEPPAYRSYMITFPRESDLNQIIEVMRPLKISNIIQNGGMVTPWSYEATLTAPKASFWPHNSPIPDSGKQAIIDKFDIGFWNIYAAQYGSPALIDEFWNIIKSEFSKIPGAKFYFAEQRPELVGLQVRDLLGKGIPNMNTFNVLNWVPNAGHITFSPISPSTGDDADKLYRMLKGECEAAGFDFTGGFVIGWREMHGILLMLFNKGDPAERTKARTLFLKLVKLAAAEGYGEYRTHVAFMDDVAESYDFNDHAMLKLCGQIKDAVDPNGILSAGKSGIWPKRLRRSS